MRAKKSLGLIVILAGAVMIDSSSAAPNDRLVSFQGDGGTAIAGTLVLPEPLDPGRPVPAILLIQGSGPTDRDGNQPPDLKTDLLRQLAQLLADAGIASLRYDKRGMHANRASMPKQPEQLADFFRWSSFVADAHAAFTYLRTYPGIASDRVGVLGHSEGGLMALDLSTRYRPQPKAIVLASTPGRPLGEVIQDQLSALLARQHATAEQRQFFLDADRRIRARILETGKVPPDVPPGLAALYPPYLGPFLKAELALDPAALARGVEAPVLVINGTGDTQVSAELDAARFSALAGRGNGSEVLTPAAVSHNLKPITAADPQGYAGAMDETVGAGIRVWLGKFL